MSSIYYPFFGLPTNHQMLAYWYNTPQDSIAFALPGLGEIKLGSSLHVYGKAPTEDLALQVEVQTQGNVKAFEREFRISQDADPEYSISFWGGSFRLVCPTEQLADTPERIVMRYKEGEKTVQQVVQCKYHRLYGTVTDFDENPFRSFIVVHPDSFDTSIGIWSDESGHYELLLPERTYNNCAVDDESYGVKTTETWAWHMILDSDRRMDFKVGNTEIYNLHAWTNNGGGKTLFISFRPMSLALYQIGSESQVELNGHAFTLADISPHLAENDIAVTLNGKESEIVSLQRYYETFSHDRGMPAYLLQVMYDGLLSSGRQELMLTVANKAVVNGEKVYHRGMGYCDFYLSYKGQSGYF